MLSALSSMLSDFCIPPFLAPSFSPLFQHSCHHPPAFSDLSKQPQNPVPGSGFAEPGIMYSAVKAEKQSEAADRPHLLSHGQVILTNILIG